MSGCFFFNYTMNLIFPYQEGEYPGLKGASNILLCVLKSFDGNSSWVVTAALLKDDLRVSLKKILCIFFRFSFIIVMCSDNDHNNQIAIVNGRIHWISSLPNISIVHIQLNTIIINYCISNKTLKPMNKNNKIKVMVHEYF